MRLEDIENKVHNRLLAWKIQLWVMVSKDKKRGMESSSAIASSARRGTICNSFSVYFLFKSSMHQTRSRRLVGVGRVETTWRQGGGDWLRQVSLYDSSKSPFVCEGSFQVQREFDRFWKPIDETNEGKFEISTNWDSETQSRSVYAVLENWSVDQRSLEGARPFPPSSRYSKVVLTVIPGKLDSGCTWGYSRRPIVS